MPGERRLRNRANGDLTGTRGALAEAPCLIRHRRLIGRGHGRRGNTYYITPPLQRAYMYEENNRTLGEGVKRECRRSSGSKEGWTEVVEEGLGLEEWPVGTRSWPVLAGRTGRSRSVSWKVRQSRKLREHLGSWWKAMTGKAVGALEGEGFCRGERRSMSLCLQEG